MTSQDIIPTLGKFATPEVITVFGALAAAWVGWKVAAKGIGIMSSMTQKAGFLGMAAAVLFVSGIGTAGLGTGELASRVGGGPAKAEKLGMSDENLLKLAEKCHDKDMAKMLTEYARVRDGDGATEDSRILGVLVERAQGKNGDSDKENKALIAYMDYLKSKEVVKIRKSDALVLATTGVVSDQAEGTKLIEEANKSKVENKDSIMSLPTSMALIGIGIASTLCGLCCWTLKKKQMDKAIA